MANIDPATGLDLDDPANQAAIARMQATAPGTPAFAAQAAGFDVDPSAQDQLFGGPASINHLPATGSASDMQQVVDSAPPLVQPEPPPAAGPPPSAPPSGGAAAPPPPVMAPPQQSTNVHSEEHTVLSPESKAALAQANAASGAQTAAAQRLAASKDAQTGGQAQDMRDAARQASIDAKQAEMVDTQRQLEHARYQEALLHANEKIKAAQAKADADFETSQKSYWADKSTGFKILSAILEGASTRNSYTLGEDPNNSPVARTIREAVEGDKAKKLAAYKRSSEYLAEARKGPEAARAAMVNAIDDINAVAASAMDVSLKKAAALASSRKLDPQRLNALIEQTKAQNANDLAETTASIAQRNLAANAVTNSRVQNTKTTAPVEKAGQDTLVYGEGGKPIGRTKTPKQAEEANTVNGAFRKMDGLMSALEQSYRTNGKAYNPFTGTYQDQKNLKAELSATWKETAKLGALSGSDYKLMEDAVGGGWTGEQGADKLKAARATAARGHAAKLDTLSLPGKQIVAQISAPAVAGEAGASVKDLTKALAAAAKDGNAAAVAAIRREIAKHGAPAQ